MRKCDIYSIKKQGMWKDNFAPENAQSAVSFCGQAADHNRRIHPENRGENGGFIRRFRNRRVNRRTEPENNKCIRSDRRFRFGSQTVDSPKEVKPRRSQWHSPWTVFAQNQAHNRASADVSEHIRETNYTTQNTHQDMTNKVLVCKVSFEENAHKNKAYICKHYKWVCATKSLQWKTKHK